MPRVDWLTGEDINDCKRCDVLCDCPGEVYCAYCAGIVQDEEEEAASATH